MTIYKRQYNIYCAESSVDNKAIKYFTIGAIITPRDQKPRITEAIKALKAKYSFKHEIKWNKVSGRYKGFYNELIELFANDNDLQYKVIVVDKDFVDINKHKNNAELMFYKFYYQLLKEKLNNDCQYYIIADTKSRNFKPRFKELEKHLENLYKKRMLNIDIKHMQEYYSHEIELLQLADFFTGITSYANSFKQDNPIRANLVKKIENVFGISLKKGTNLHFEKFNIFKWMPKAENGSY